MLHTKFRENRPSSSVEEDFLRVFTKYGRGSLHGQVPLPKKAPHKIWL